MPADTSATDIRLKEETGKWLDKLEKEVRTIKPTGKIEKEKLDPVIENINAYISDCKHFLEKRDLINAFEAAIYAWGILETCQHLGLIEKE
jgi:hypothetical protein